MFNRKTATILAVLSILAISCTACGISLPGSISAAEAEGTSVAATVQALKSTVESVLTPEAHNVSTLPSSTEEPAAPVSMAFVGPDRNAFYWNETLSSPVMLTASGDVSTAFVSPDGLLVALTRTVDEISYSLDVINSDGTGQRPLFTATAFADLPRPDDSLASIPNQIAWIPGTHILAMNTRITFEGPGSSTGNTIYLINTDDGSITAPITLTDVWSYRFTVAPDGTKVAISLPEGIEIYHLDGTKLDHKVLSYDFVNTASEYAWVASPIWSADSTTLAAAVPPVEPFADPVADSTVWKVAADGLSGEMTFSRQMAYFPGGFASISPDLNKILYLTRYTTGSDSMYAVNLSNLDGSEAVQYAEGRFSSVPQWSTDSSKFYYYKNDTGAFLGVPGSTPTSLTDFAYTRKVQWIDDNRFIGASGPEGGWKLLLGTVGGATGVIHSTPSTDGTLTFTLNR